MFGERDKRNWVVCVESKNMRMVYTQLSEEDAGKVCHDYLSRGGFYVQAWQTKRNK